MVAVEQVWGKGDCPFSQDSFAVLQTWHVPCSGVSAAGEVQWVLGDISTLGCHSSPPPWLARALRQSEFLTWGKKMPKHSGSSNLQNRGSS